MGFLKSLFTGKEDPEKDKTENKEEKDFDMFKYDGIKAMRQGKTTFALECFKRAIEIKEDREVRENLAHIYATNDKLDEAIEQLEKLEEQYPNDIKILESLTNLCFLAEKYDLLETTCNKALEIDNTLAFPHFLLAKKAKATDDKFNAVSQSTLAIVANRNFFEAYTFRAEILKSMSQFSEAEKDVDFVLDNDTNVDEEVKLLKADICAALDKFEEAEKYYKEVIEYNPFIPKAYIGLGSILVKSKRNEEALNTIEDGIEQNSSSSELFRARAGIRLIFGDKESASEDMKRAQELIPEEEKKNQEKIVSMEDTMLNAYNAINPYQFDVKI